MTIDELFPNPTVKQVIFQIKFPNLFYIENKIGDFQMKVMDVFPESALLFRRQFVFADVGPEGRMEDVDKDFEGKPGAKIWQFKSEKNFQLNIMSNSLDISSSHHKTYNLDNGGDKFRDIIKFALDAFLEITPITIINRIGLRYIDECPIPLKDNESFLSYYDSNFPLDRFDISDADAMEFKTIVKRGDCFLRCVESLKKIKEEFKLILDFDGYAEKISPDEYLNVADKLHDLILEEYDRTIKEPVKEYMRKPREE